MRGFLRTLTTTGQQCNGTYACSLAPRISRRWMATTASAHLINNDSATTTSSPSDSAISSTSSWFVKSRQEILDKLAANRDDRSLAGRVDPLIAPTVACINADPRYVTLSSCSGRLSLFHRASSLKRDTTSTSASSAPASSEASPATTSLVSKAAMKRGTGLGTLYQTHDPYTKQDGSQQAAVDSILSALREFNTLHGGVALSASSSSTELLQLKFEPMILHVMCSTLDDAVALLNAANDAGQRRSGILAVSHRDVQQPTTGATSGSSSAIRDGGKFTVNITSALHYDVPLLANGAWCVPLQGQPDAVKESVEQWVDLAGRLFEENTARTMRFRKQFDVFCVRR